MVKQQNNEFKILKLITYLRKQDLYMPVDPSAFTDKGPTITGHIAICFGYCDNSEVKEIKGKSIYDFIQRKLNWSLVYRP